MWLSLHHCVAHKQCNLGRRPQRCPKASVLISNRCPPSPWGFLHHGCDLTVSRSPAKMEYALRTRAAISKGARGPGSATRCRQPRAELVLRVDSEPDGSCPRGSHCWGCQPVPTARSAQNQRPVKLTQVRAAWRRGQFGL